MLLEYISEISKVQLQILPGLQIQYEEDGLYEEIKSRCLELPPRHNPIHKLFIDM